MQQYYTVSEAAEYLGVSRQSVESCMKRGIIAYSKRPMKVTKKVIPLSELVKRKEKQAIAIEQ